MNTYGFPIFKIDPFGNIAVYTFIEDTVQNTVAMFRYGINPSYVDTFYKEGYATYPNNNK